MDKSRREIEESLNSSRNMPTWVFWPKFIKMSLIMSPIMVLLLYLTFRNVKTTGKPKTAQSRQTQSSF